MVVLHNYKHRIACLECGEINEPIVRQKRTVMNCPSCMGIRINQSFEVHRANGNKVDCAFCDESSGKVWVEFLKRECKCPYCDGSGKRDLDNLDYFNSSYALEYKLSRMKMR